MTGRRKRRYGICESPFHQVPSTPGIAPFHHSTPLPLATGGDLDLRFYSDVWSTPAQHSRQNASPSTVSPAGSFLTPHGGLHLTHLSPFPTQSTPIPVREKTTPCFTMSLVEEKCASITSECSALQNQLVPCTPPPDATTRLRKKPSLQCEKNVKDRHQRNASIHLPQLQAHFRSEDDNIFCDTEDEEDPVWGLEDITLSQACHVITAAGVENSEQADDDDSAIFYA